MNYRIPKTHKKKKDPIIYPIPKAGIIFLELKYFASYILIISLYFSFIKKYFLLKE